MSEKTCAKCREEKPLDAFTNNKTNLDGKASYCRACKNAKHAAWIAGNPEAARKNRERSLAWQKTERGRDRSRMAAKRHYLRHRDRLNEVMRVRHRAARLAGRASLLSLMGGKCARCSFDDERALQVDHVHGGGCREQKEIGTQTRFWKKVTASVRAGLGEYQLLCANCNAIKRRENANGAEKSGPKPGRSRLRLAAPEGEAAE